MRVPGWQAVGAAGRAARAAVEPFDEPAVETSRALIKQLNRPGLIGSLLMSVGAFGAGWIAPAAGVANVPILNEIRSSQQLKFTSKMLLMAGVGLLLLTWARLGHHVRTRRILDPTRLTRLVFWWSAPLLLSPVLFSRDLFSYVAHSRLLPNGVDPYLYGTGVFDTFYLDGADALWTHAPAPYGPLWMGLSSITFGVTGARAIPALIAFRLLAFAGVVLIAVFLPRLAKLCGVDPAKAIWLGLLNPLVLLHFVSAAHNDALMMGLLIAGVTLTLERRLVPGIVLVSLAGAVKSPALLALPFIGLAWAGPAASLARRVKMWAIAGVSAVGVFVVLNLVTGLDFGWINGLSTPGRVRTWLSPMTGLGMLTGNLADLVGLGYRVDGAVAAWRGVGTVATVILILWLVFTADRRSAARGLGLALLGLVMLGPVVQPWYLLWALVILAGSGLSRGEIRAAVLLSIGFVVYSVANANATVPLLVGSLSDGLAALASVLVVVLLLVASRRSRAVLLEDAFPLAADEAAAITMRAAGRVHAG